MAQVRRQEEPMSEQWIDGTLESGADDDQGPPTTDQDIGAGLGVTEGVPNTFEPEEASPGGTVDPDDDDRSTG